MEVAIDSHELGGETGVSGDGDAVLALHRDHRVAVVLVLKKMKTKSITHILLALLRRKNNDLP